MKHKDKEIQQRMLFSMQVNGDPFSLKEQLGFVALRASQVRIAADPDPLSALICPIIIKAKMYNNLKKEQLGHSVK